ncbi:MAG TPA: FCD domain-containing protein [Anaerolineaceae bacterium]|nr:FCD domain-containing protein [Anaerolineaceae bacterium]HNS38434.1 FCD domain-containing protein [Anaerolineaceae bacterium]
MLRERNVLEQSAFLQYLTERTDAEGDRLPPLSELSQQLGVSIASLREQLEVARTLGVVEVRPKVGIRRLPYRFKPAVLTSLGYAVSLDTRSFRAFSDLRNHLEMSYYMAAVSLLKPEDHAELRALVQSAQARLNRPTPQIPHAEHRDLHLLIYRRLNNPFVTGLLEAYWDMYEAIGLNVYTDMVYLKRVWEYHDRMVEAICVGDFATGYQALIDHMNLIYERSKSDGAQKFE